MNLSELGGFPKPYVELLIGDDTSPRAVPRRREELLTKAREVAKAISPGSRLVDAIQRGTLPFSRSPACKRSTDIPALEQSALIVAMPRIERSGGSMSQLLKCVTAARLVRDLQLQGIPAAPVCWLMAHSMEPLKDGAEFHGLSEACGTTEENFIHRIRYLLKSALEKEDISEAPELFASADPKTLVRYLWTCLGRDFGWLAADPGIGHLRQNHSGGPPGAGERWEELAAVDSVEPIMRLAPGLPIAAIVVGPDDFREAGEIADRIESAGSTRPVLFPRVSATILDRRSSRIMRKYGFRLTDLLVQQEPQAAASGYGRDPSTIVGGINAAARSVEAAVEELAAGLAGQARLSRRIRANGARILFQVKKVEARARRAFENLEAVLRRHGARLKARVAPEGSLQEESLSVLDFVECFSPDAVSMLYRQVDIWDHRHQLICLDEKS
ncbi:MAG: bacillithiol biosynthesis BshC [Acidobacteria bacterium]|nr:bacillithiol biosynthesis BshC [Acidobacteriota bacterium]